MEQALSLALSSFGEHSRMSDAQGRSSLQEPGRAVENHLPELMLSEHQLGVV